jgi:hypothetical protein
MIIENSEIGYLRGKLHEGRTRLEEVSPSAWGVEKPQKRHICLHTFTSHKLGYRGMSKYNTLVISYL